MHNRIALGTAQFGFSYGISNIKGQTSESECKAILDYAQNAGIRTLDTAIAYGESERVLGDAGINNWQVITKLPAIPDDISKLDQWVSAQLEGAMKRLKISALHAVLLHRPDQLLSPVGNALYACLIEQQKQGTIKKIGISIYGPEELVNFPEFMRFDIVQAPFNVLDRRMISSGWADRIIDQGAEFHARSIFLQGLLLMSRASRPKQFNSWNSLWSIWDIWLTKNNVSALEACLNHVLKISQISKLIIGVNDLVQLTEILKAINPDCPSPPAELSSLDTNLINPACWNLS